MKIGVSLIPLASIVVAIMLLVNASKDEKNKTRNQAIGIPLLIVAFLWFLGLIRQ